MGAYLDISGQRYGRLVAIERCKRKKGKKTAWMCVCDCGNEANVNLGDLRSGRTKSCGCYRRENTAIIGKTAKRVTHGDTDSRLYRIWNAMKNRCLRESTNAYQWYGNRGISICNEWLEYQEFKAWAVENGYSDKLTIDRIDNEGNYEPSNCRWITNKEQQRNKSNSRFITIDGETKCLSEWAEMHDMDRSTLRYRLNAGWDKDRLFI